VNVIDSSAWIEYLGDGPNANAFAGAIEDTSNVVVPTLALYEVFKFVARTAGEDAAFDAVTMMMAASVVDLTAAHAIEAARISLVDGLPMADAMILAVARAEDAVLWTQDAHFAGLAGVEHRRT